jgi:hypothetical protein
LTEAFGSDKIVLLLVETQKIKSVSTYKTDAHGPIDEAGYHAVPMNFCALQRGDRYSWKSMIRWMQKPRVYAHMMKRLKTPF